MAKLSLLVGLSDLGKESLVGLFREGDRVLLRKSCDRIFGDTKQKLADKIFRALPFAVTIVHWSKKRNLFRRSLFISR
jgi:hypothetical protein